jgi:Ca-activated chloride channel family protein
MRRAAILLGAALALLVAAPGWAQAPQAVRGGGSFSDAPLLEPGVYTDTLRTSEELFYAIELQRGQQLTARLTVVGQPDRDRVSRYPQIQVLNPNREESTRFESREIGDSTEESTTEVVGERVGAENSDLFSDPGRYYVRVDFSNSDGEDREYETQLTLEVEGDPLPDPAQEPGPVEPAPQEPAPPSPQGAAPVPAVGSSGGDAGVLIAAFVASLLVGALLGAGGGLLVRGRSGAG